MPEESKFEIGQRVSHKGCPGTLEGFRTDAPGGFRSGVPGDAPVAIVRWDDGKTGDVVLGELKPRPYPYDYVVKVVAVNGVSRCVIYTDDTAFGFKDEEEAFARARELAKKYVGELGGVLLGLTVRFGGVFDIISFLG